MMSSSSLRRTEAEAFNAAVACRDTPGSRDGGEGDPEVVIYSTEPKLGSNRGPDTRCTDTELWVKVLDLDSAERGAPKGGNLPNSRALRGGMRWFRRHRRCRNRSGLGGMSGLSGGRFLRGN